MFGKSQKSPSMKVPLVVTSLGSKLIFSAGRHSLMIFLDVYSIKKYQLLIRIAFIRNRPISESFISASHSHIRGKTRHYKSLSNSRVSLLKFLCQSHKASESPAKVPRVAI